MTQTIWLPEMSTGSAAIDELHQDFFRTLVQAASVTDKKFSAGYGALIAKVEHAFATEERWMEEIDFASLKAHREQHARILGALHHIHSKVMAGELATGRDVVERLLPQWFLFHMSTMDAALAMSMQTADAETAHSMFTPSSDYVD
jgi:hemerythrin